MALRMVQNADIKLENVFVPDANKLQYALNFEKSANKVLLESRLGVGLACTGISCGAYEACLEYCLKRNQFYPEQPSPNLFCNRLEIRMKAYYNNLYSSFKL